MSRQKDFKEKALHRRNKNRGKYDLKAMSKAYPLLKQYIIPNKAGQDSIDFSSPQAVRVLNQAILKFYYGIKYWDFPLENLCPPIPGRAEYIHHTADLLAESNGGRIPKGQGVRCLDIGTGASCIYPIIGVVEYNWNFTVSETSKDSLISSEDIINGNSALKDKVRIIRQHNPDYIFKEIIGEKDKFDISICNPPFHASAEDATKGASRKVKNLHGQKGKKPQLNFSGTNDELVYKGGEIAFISIMISESADFSKSCLWFTTLVSKEKNLKPIYKQLKEHKPAEIKTLDVSTGNKKSRIVAWSFFAKEERRRWMQRKGKM